LEIGAQLLAILCFPDYEERRQAAARGFCARLVKWNIAEFPEHAAELRKRFSDYAGMFDWEVKRALRGVNTLLRYRAVAGRMGRGFLQERYYGQPAVLPSPMVRLSLNQLSMLVQREARQSEPENVEKRIWRPSRKVIGLAVAFDQVVDSGAANDNGFLLQDLATIDEIIKKAIQHETYVLEDSRFGVTAEELVRVRWI
jgi:hypothetical protein